MTVSAHDLHKQMEAAKVLKANLADLLARDPDFLPEAIEAETNLFEMIGALAISVRTDEALADGASKLAENLKARKGALEKRAETKRSMIAAALEIAGVKSHETPAGTVSIKVVPPKVIITEEADIPSSYFKSSDPVLDRKALGEALKARAKALDAASKLDDEAERESARTAAEREFPPVPGAVLSNGSATIQIRG